MENKILLAEHENSTVVAEFKSIKVHSNKFESEAELEEAFIKLLIAQGYEYLSIKNNNDLKNNLRKQIEKLNNYQFTNNEWESFLSTYLLNPNDGIEARSKKIHEDYSYPLKKDKDSITKNIKIIDKNNIHNNSIQVINQYQNNNLDNQQKTRYDVSILINGLPLVHIELKRRGTNLKEAFNQIKRYANHSFTDLYLYTQIYVISNGTQTKYYSNTTRETSIKERNNTNSKKTSNSFEFTSYWADSKNNQILDLIDFCQTFFAKHTILNILTKYCVFTSDNTLMVLRPYQIVATERIINRIKISLNDKKLLGTTGAGGYIWHTTGSGKTLTSFKTATLAKEIEGVDKVLFVVDRKDLDYQTTKEYEKYSKGCVSANTNVNELAKQIGNQENKIIITTIQKLGIFISKNPKHPIYSKNVVLVFDECHRSQFGDLHKKITKKSFKKYMVFGFTGTPILEENSNVKNKNIFFATEHLFGACLHKYTIDKAIRDGNVLGFRTEYYKTLSEKDDIDDETSSTGIDKKEALENPIRISEIVDFILKNYNRLTKRNEEFFEHNKIANINEVITSRNKLSENKVLTTLNGFNSILACSSINAAKIYYSEFKKQQQKFPQEEKLKIGLIYSYLPSEQESNDNELSNFELLDENNENTNQLDLDSRNFLDEAIKDYNEMFGTSYSTDNANFNNYYKDFSLRLKDRSLDIAIVVNMFLTGFDATTLNTLWLDKKLKYHSLIQAMSRTNRILNSVKSNGNIVFFRNLENAVNEALRLFSSESNINSSIAILRSFKEYYEGYYNEDNQYIQGYRNLVEELKSNFKIPFNGTKEEERIFIKLFGDILKYKNLLSQFSEFEQNDDLIGTEMQDYQSIYIGLRDKYQDKKRMETDSIVSDLDFKIELISQQDIGVDYILKLMNEKLKKDLKEVKYHDLERDILSSLKARKKKDLIIEFVNEINKLPNKDEIDIFNEWSKFIKNKKESELIKIINENKLDNKKTFEFMKKAFENNEFNENGVDIVNLMPPTSFFKKSNQNSNRSKIKENATEKLLEYFEKFRG